MEQDNLESVMSLIIHAGNAKSCAMEAIQSAKKREFELAQKSLDEAAEEITLAHNKQTVLLQKEANGEKNELSLLVVHSQDHLMTAITFIDLAKEIIELYQQIN